MGRNFGRLKEMHQERGARICQQPAGQPIKHPNYHTGSLISWNSSYMGVVQGCLERAEKGPLFENFGYIF